ncbi:hypothetical protein LTR74_013236 [Friedmanniomyces endolithicus]|nr:hypothetical protein LTR74_013236 [Friedmanniomyces endolithicus]
MSSHTNQANGALDERSIPPMGMTGQAFLDAAGSVVNDIERYYTSLPSRPVLPSILPGYLQKLLPSAPPTHGEPWADIESDIERTIMPGILGEMWSAALTSANFNWICSPAVTELETIVLDWLAQILALPDLFLSKGEGGGVIQGSASEAVVTVMVAARERYIRGHLERQGVTDPDEIEDQSCELRGKLVAFASAEAHSSTKKGAIIAGTRFRSIPVHRSDGYALTGKQVRAKIEELQARGLHPYYLGVTLGTTNTCAVDDFESIAEVAKDYPDIWIHCDAAYAGSALVLPEYQCLSKQMTLVDSFNMNMHKWLLTNFDASCLYVRKRQDLTDALSITPTYLKNQFTDSGLVTDYRDWQIPLGRRFRSLKIWFVLRTWGVEGLKQHIRHHLKLADLFVELVKSRSDIFRLLTPPKFALTVLTIKPRNSKPPELAEIDKGDPRPFQDQHIPIELETDDHELQKVNDVTKDVYTKLDETKEFFLTASVVGGVYAIRVVAVNPLAEEKYIRRVFELLVEITERVLESPDETQH